MQDFIHVNRKEQKKRDVSERIKDFKEIYNLLNKKDIPLQSGRCIQCGDPFCHDKCPLHNYIPFWLRSMKLADATNAFNLSNETNPYPEITGRVCPQDKLCEGACTLNDGHGAINIGGIETYISEEGFKKGLKPKFAPLKKGKKVAIIGSGPASISAATYLLRSGIRVDMYEKNAKAGGLLSYGIPNFKLEKSVVQRRVDWLVEAGMSLHVGLEVGKDIEFESLLEEYDALFLGIGAESSRKANIENENAKGSFLAIDFLTNVQKKIFNEPFDSRYNVKDKNVVVVGGGDTAMDCLRVAIREGAKSVQCLYRRDRKSMGGSKKEFKNACDEGARFVYNVAPKELIVNEQNQIIGLHVENTMIDTKTNKLQIIKQSQKRVDADIVIFALGFLPQKSSFLSEYGIQCDEMGRILTDENFQTTQKGIYAGGDCVRGASLVVHSAADGKEAAKSIIKEIM